MNHEYRRGFYDALDRIMNFINALDSGDMTPRDVRSAIYGKALELRPASNEKEPK